jgi:ankyrin repeat protein
MLVKANASMNNRDSSANTALTYGKFKKKNLLDLYSKFLIFSAVQNGCWDVVNETIQAKMDLNVPDKNGNTPLMRGKIIQKSFEYFNY